MSAVRAEAPLAPEFEGEIREFIRRDVAHLRRPQPEGPAADAVNNLNSLLDRVSGSSVQEIDELIRDLRNVRNFLQTEGERVQREITSYAQLSQVAMTSVKIIAESMSAVEGAGRAGHPLTGPTAPTASAG